TALRRTMRQLIAIGLSAALFIPLVHEAAAEKRGAPVPPGSTRKEVIALRGEPKERIEAETKRTETWIYPGDEIVFRGDKVIDIRVSPPEPEAEPLAEVSGESVSIK